MPPDPLEVCASDTDGASLPAGPLHQILSNTIENPIGVLIDLFYGQPVLEGEQCTAAGLSIIANSDYINQDPHSRPKF